MFSLDCGSNNLSLASQIKNLRCIICIVMGLQLLFPGNALFSSVKKQKVYVISVSGTVDPFMAADIKTALEEIKNKKDAVVIFKMNTFGGRVDAALDIVNMISSLPDGKTIAFVEKKAISAGALIALSSNFLFMEKNTIIGDCAPIINSSEGMKMAGEKIQTVLRAKFRALAKKNNYPVVLAQSMVSTDMEVYQVVMNGRKKFIAKKDYDDLTKNERKKITSKKTIVAKGKLLTMDDAEAFDLGFSQKSVKNINDALSFLGYKSIDLVIVEGSWSAKLIRFLHPFMPLLMLIGIGALYTEIKAPGFGIPGITGIICLGLVFFSQHLVGLADYTELLIMGIGFLLLGVEVFVLPGFGIAGITGLLAIAAGLVLSLQGFVIPDPSLPWQGRLFIINIAEVAGSFICAFLIPLFMIRFVLPWFSKIVKGPYLEANLSHSHVDVTTSLGLKPGDKGIAHTFLRPSGKIMINNKKIDAITRGEFIDQGQFIIIDKIGQNHVIVKPET